MSIDKLQQVFRQVFEDNDFVITPKLNASDVAAWDSFNHINLIVGIEECFGIRFSVSEITGMKNVGDLVEILNKKNVLISWN